MTPIIQGGQGRSARDTRESATAFGWFLFIGFLLFAALACWGWK